VRPTGPHLFLLFNLSYTTFINRTQVTKFQDTILSYYKEHKRPMSWRDISNPYKVFVSEMMLQQTQVARVTLKYEEFIKAFPTLKSVAEAPKEEILKIWQGLGYNRRALFIHNACKQILSDHNGEFPADEKTLQTLPGIGPATAGAICAFAYNTPVNFIETNVRAVLLHFFFKNKLNVTDKELLETLKKVTPKDIAPRDWYYALYDYGTHLKKTLGKEKTKLHKQSKHYKKQSKFEGSFRQKRAQILKLKLNEPDISDSEILIILEITPSDFEEVIISLDKDGLL